MRRKKRVRLHILTPSRSEHSVEGLLVSRRHSEYLLALPELLVDPQRDPVALESRWAAYPKEHVWMVEFL